MKTFRLLKVTVATLRPLAAHYRDSMGVELAMPVQTAEVAIARDVETVKHLIRQIRRRLLIEPFLHHISKDSHSALVSVFVLSLLLGIISAT